MLALPRRGVARRHDPEDARQQLVRTATEERDTPRSREPKGRAGGSGPALPADPNRTPAPEPSAVRQRDWSTDENAHPIAAVGGLAPTWDDQGQSRGVQTPGVVVAT